MRFCSLHHLGLNGKMCSCGFLPAWLRIKRPDREIPNLEHDNDLTSDRVSPLKGLLYLCKRVTTRFIAGYDLSRSTLQVFLLHCRNTTFSCRMYLRYVAASLRHRRMAGCNYATESA